MREPPLILVVDDVPDNVDILQMRLEKPGAMRFVSAGGTGSEALVKNPRAAAGSHIARRHDAEDGRHRGPSSGLKADAALPFTPVILVTAKADGADVIAGLESGGDRLPDEARGSCRAVGAGCARCCASRPLHDTVQGAGTAARGGRRASLPRGTRRSGSKLRCRSAEIERIGRLKRFSLAPQIAETIVASGGEAILEATGAILLSCSAICAAFTALAETAEPEDCDGGSARISLRRSDR